MNADDTATTPEPLPVRTRRSRAPSGGRHRRPGPPVLPTTAPTLVLASPGTGPEDTRVADELARHAAETYVGLDVRVGHLTGGARHLGEVLRACVAERAGTGAADEPAFDTAAVVVPLTTRPGSRFVASVTETVTETGTPTLVTEGLGPHPLLAEALHTRLADAELVRPDRIHQLGVNTAVDGVVVGVSGDEEAVSAATATAVFLASRIAIAVVAASLDDAGRLAEATTRLRNDGAERLGLAPCVLTAPPAETIDAAQRAGLACAAPLGAHPAVARLAVQSYEATVARSEMAAAERQGR